MERSVEGRLFPLGMGHWRRFADDGVAPFSGFSTTNWAFEVYGVHVHSLRRWGAGSSDHEIQNCDAIPFPAHSRNRPDCSQLARSVPFEMSSPSRAEASGIHRMIIASALTGRGGSHRVWESPTPAAKTANIEFAPNGAGVKPLHPNEGDYYGHPGCRIAAWHS
jgi:hypothetical protein